MLLSPLLDLQPCQTHIRECICAILCFLKKSIVCASSFAALLVSELPFAPVLLQCLSGCSHSKLSKGVSLLRGSWVRGCWGGILWTQSNYFYEREEEVELEVELVLAHYQMWCLAWPSNNVLPSPW